MVKSGQRGEGWSSIWWHPLVCLGECLPCTVQGCLGNLLHGGVWIFTPPWSPVCIWAPWLAGFFFGRVLCYMNSRSITISKYAWNTHRHFHLSVPLRSKCWLTSGFKKPSALSLCMYNVFTQLRRSFFITHRPIDELIPEVNKHTAEELFFVGCAQIWKSTVRDEDKGL